MSQPDIHDVVNQLCAPHTLHEPIGRTTEKYTTRNPSLLAQLAEAVEPSTSAGASGAGFASKPAARIDAIDTLTRIDIAAARWVRDLGEDDPGDTVACVRKLAGLRPSASEVAQKAIDRDIRRWWTWARMVTGWDAPAFRPDNTCPLCNERGALRIKIVEVMGMCIECHATWSGDDEIKILAQHIKWENNDEDEDAA